MNQLKDGLSTGIRGVAVPRAAAPIDRAAKTERERAGRYGLTVDELRALGDACMVCGFTGPLVVDHDHDAADRHGHPPGRCCRLEVRGVLCDYCNTGLGKFQDRPELLRAGADYLEAALVRRLAAGA